jgi:hypothetical protein
MNIECPICFNNIVGKDICITNCKHQFCYDCLKKWFEKKKDTCPNCRQKIDTFEYHNEKNRIIYINTIDDINLTINDFNVILRDNINYNTKYKKLLIFTKLIGFITLTLLSTNIYILVDYNIN